MEKENQVLTDGTLILKATKNYIVKELASKVESKDAQEYFNQADQFCSNGKYAEAKEALEKSLANCPTMSAFLNLGNVLSITVKYADAYNVYNKGLELARKARDKWFKGAFLSNIGIIHLEEGKPDKALNAFNDALVAFRNADDKQEEDVANVLNKIGSVYIVMDEKDAALEHFNNAAAIFKAIGLKMSGARCLNDIALTHIDKMEHKEALKHFRDALALFKEFGSREDEASQLGNIGSTLRDLNEKDEALKFYGESLCIFKEIGNRMGIADQLTNIGYILSLKDDFNGALKHYEEALPLYQEFGAASKAEMTQRNINILRRKLNNL